MGRFAKDSGGGDFKQPPTGNHVARCIKITDLGTEHGEYQGQPRVRNQVLVTWELCNELMDDGRPFTVSNFYTNSLSEKATLRHHLEAWRGRSFTEEELAGFDLQNILGKPCMLSVVLNDKGKAKVGAVASMPKGMVAPDPVNPVTAFWIDEWDQAAYEKIPDGIRKIIDASEEVKALRRGRAAPAKPAVALADLDDDIPFDNPYRGRICYVV